jgi:AAHS family 4-hydroxybenzoate transporter-like MFS transporter
MTEAKLNKHHLRVAWLCGAVLFLEGYDIAAVGYAIPSLVDAWQVHPPVFTQVLTAGNVGLLLGSLCAGLLGDRLGRKPLLIACVAVFGVFSLLSALTGSPLQLAGLRFLTGLGLGGGIPLAIALATDFAPPMGQGRFLILISAGVPIGFAVGGLLASPRLCWCVAACSATDSGSQSASSAAIASGSTPPTTKIWPTENAYNRGSVPKRTCA